MSAPRRSRVTRRPLLDTRDRRILALAVPALGSLAVEPLYVLVDTAIVGHLGRDPLGGLALASTVLAGTFWVFGFLAQGTTSRVAFLLGRGHPDAASAAVVQAVWLAGGLGVLAAIFTAVAGPAITHALGGTQPVLDAAATYLRISALGTPFVFLTLVGHGWFRGLSDTRTPLAVVVVANLLNVVLEVVLVYGFDTGVAGSAWGTVVAQVVAAAWLAVLTLRRMRATGAAMPSWAPRITVIRGLLAVGGHLVLRTALLISIFALATSAASNVGPDALGGHQIAHQVFIFLAMSTDALAIAAQAMSGRLLGSGDAAELRSVVARLVRLTVLVGVALAVLVVVVSPFLPHAFSGDGDVVRQATVALLFVAALQVPGAIAFTFDGILMGASDFSFLAKAMAVAFASFLPFFVAVRVWPHLGLATVWTGLVLAMCVRATTNWRRGRATVWGEGAAPADQVVSTATP